MKSALLGRVLPDVAEKLNYSLRTWDRRLQQWLHLSRLPLKTHVPILDKIVSVLCGMLGACKLYHQGKTHDNSNRTMTLSADVLARDWLRSWWSLPWAIPLITTNRSEHEVDILLPKGATLTVAGPGTPSLRHSIEKAVNADLQSGRWADKLACDDPEQPRLFLHGWHTPIDDLADLQDPDYELWTAHASAERGCFYASLCSWVSRLSSGSPHIHLTAHEGEDPLAWADGDDRSVLGYIYLLAIDEAFYLSSPGVHDVPPLPWFSCSDPAKRPLVARRRNYAPTADVASDAFIFTREAVLASGLKVVRSYRLICN